LLRRHRPGRGKLCKLSGGVRFPEVQRGTQEGPGGLMNRFFVTLSFTAIGPVGRHFPCWEMAARVFAGSAVLTKCFVHTLHKHVLQRQR